MWSLEGKKHLVAVEINNRLVTSLLYYNFVIRLLSN